MKYKARHMQSSVGTIIESLQEREADAARVPQS